MVYYTVLWVCEPYLFGFYICLVYPWLLSAAVYYWYLIRLFAHARPLIFVAVWLCYCKVPCQRRYVHLWCAAPRILRWATHVPFRARSNWSDVSDGAYCLPPLHTDGTQLWLQLQCADAMLSCTTIKTCWLWAQRYCCCAMYEPPYKSFSHTRYQ